MTGMLSRRSLIGAAAALLGTAGSGVRPTDLAKAAASNVPIGSLRGSVSDNTGEDTWWDDTSHARRVLNRQLSRYGESSRRTPAHIGSKRSRSAVYKESVTMRELMVLQELDNRLSNRLTAERVAEALGLLRRGSAPDRPSPTDIPF